MISQAPEGYKRVWLPEDSTWRIARDPKPCRYLQCGEPSVAQLKRSNRRYSAWWSYCGNHLYGRRLRNGVIEYLGLVRA